jgi:hypothetical protein
LAADAAALQQIKSLAVCINEENDNPNKTIKDGLCQVDSSVTELEGKVRLLHEICAEEKQSLKDMEAVKKAAEAQHEILKDMLQAHDSVVQQRQKEQQTQVAISSHVVIANNNHTPARHRDSASTPREGVLQSGAKRVARRRDSMDPREKQHHSSFAHSIHLERVTQSEWNTVSRTIRGRITLAVVNDALRDIERVFQKKYAVLSHKSRKHHGPPGQMELQQKLLNSHRELQVEEHGENPWVSEQDLRQCCAFFRNGESTARAILLIIRTLRRLKQVPAKNSEVTYVCRSSAM